MQGIRRIGGVVFRGVPSVRPEAAALFRIMIAGFGTQMLHGRLGKVVDLGPGGRLFPDAMNRGWIHWLATDAWASQAALDLSYIAAGATLIGILTPVATLVWAMSLMVLMLRAATHGSTHDITLLWWVLLAASVSGWGRAWSVDALLRTVVTRLRKRDAAPAASLTSKRYGFAMWATGLVLGLAYLAASFAKLDMGGLQWITGGAIAYHFLEDGTQATLRPGYWLLTHRWAAILLSLGAILGEALIILHLLSPKDRWRILAGLTALGIHISFYLFMDVLWIVWMALLTAFLPWNAISKMIGAGLQQIGKRLMPRGTIRSPNAGPQDPVTSRAKGIPWLQAAVAALIVAQQVFISAIRYEYEPVMTNYPMYAQSYASPQAYYDSRQWSLFSGYYMVDLDDPDRPIDLTRLGYTDELGRWFYSLSSAVMDTARGYEREEVVLRFGPRMLMFQRALRDIAGVEVRHIAVYRSRATIDWTTHTMVMAEDATPIAVMDLEEGWPRLVEPGEIPPASKAVSASQMPYLLKVSLAPPALVAGKDPATRKVQTYQWLLENGYLERRDDPL